MPSGSDEKNAEKFNYFFTLQASCVCGGACFGTNRLKRFLGRKEDANIIAKKYRGSTYFKALMSGTNSPAVTSRSCFKNIVIYTGR